MLSLLFFDWFVIEQFADICDSQAWTLLSENVEGYVVLPLGQMLHTRVSLFSYLTSQYLCFKILTGIPWPGRTYVEHTVTENHITRCLAYLRPGYHYDIFGEYAVCCYQNNIGIATTVSEA